MIDLVALLALTAVATFVVVRLRHYGFSGIWTGPGLGVPQMVLKLVTEGLARARRPSSLELAQVESDDETAWDVPTATLAESSPPPRSFARAWIVAAGLLMCAVLLQRQLWQNQTDLTPFWLLLATGIGFATIVGRWLVESLPGFERRPGLTFDSPADRQESPGRYWRSDLHSRKRAGQLLVAAAAAEGLALVCFPIGALGGWGWLLHLGAATLFVQGLSQLSRVGFRQLMRDCPRWELASVALLIVIAFAARLWQLADLPPGIFSDEAQRGIEALHITADPGYRPVFVPVRTQEPTAFWYLIVPFIGLFGPTPLALRLPSVLAGCLGVGALYLLARILFDRRTALVAGAITAALTWHLTFSRLAFPDMYSVGLDALAAGLLVVGLRRRSALALGAAGLAAGLALHFYYSSWLFPLVLVLFLTHRIVSGRGAFLRVHAAGLLLAAAGFALAAAPLAQFAALHPSEFTRRLGTVSVLNEVLHDQSWAPLVESARAHLLMFNVRGDNNGRHNWSGRPMLDEVTGALAILGLFLAISRSRRSDYALPVLWLPVAMASGIFAISGEAPQANRSIDALTPLVLLAALPVSTLLNAAGRLRWWHLSFVRSQLEISPLLRAAVRPSTLVTGLVSLGLIGTGLNNLNRYFNYQERDPRTWTESFVAETTAGREINEVPAGWAVYVDPVLNGDPSLKFMLQNPREFPTFTAFQSTLLPRQGTALFLTDREASAAKYLASLYPELTWNQLRVPGRNDVALNTLLIPPEVFQAHQGVLLHYSSAAGSVDQLASQVNFDWLTRTPPPLATGNIQSTLAAPETGSYRFALEAADDVTLNINGANVLSGGRETTLVLARGAHALQIDAPTVGETPLRLYWSPPNGQLQLIPPTALLAPPIQATGLLARLYPGNVASGLPALEQIDPEIDLRVHLLPWPRPYTIEWTGSLLATREGSYRFSTDSRDASTVWIDGRPIVNNPTGVAEGSTQLSAGWHDLRVRLLDSTNYTHIQLYWTPPGQAQEIIPSHAIRAWPASIQPEQTEQSIFTDIPPPAPQPGAPTATGQAPTSGGRKLGPPGAVAEPRGLAIGPDGTVFVADAGKHAIVAIDPDGATHLLGNGQFEEPTAVAVLPNGGLVVLDAKTGSLQRMGRDGTRGERLIPTEGLFGPRGMAAAKDGRLVVADTGGNRLLVLGADGRLTQTIGGLKEPTDAAFLPDGTLLVAETGANQLVIVGLDGKRGASWPMPASTTVQGPHVAVLPNGGWVATAPEQRGLLRMSPGGGSPQPSQPAPDWHKPVGIAAGQIGLVVADFETGVISLIALP